MLPRVCGDVIQCNAHRDISAFIRHSVTSMDITGRFNAADASGTLYLVLRYQQRIDTSTVEGESFEYGLPDYRLSDGGALNCLDDDTFQIVKNGTVLKRQYRRTDA
jgi:hypothetical protein